MKVIVATGLYPPEIGGPATYSALLEAGLPRAGIEVVVVPFCTVRGYTKIFRHAVYFWTVFRRAKGADIIVALDPMSVGLPALVAAVLRRKTFVLKVVGDYAWEQSTQRFGFPGTIEEFQNAKLGVMASLFRTMERNVARRAERVIVPSHYLEKIVRQWGVLEDRLVVIYNGVSVGDVGKKETIRGMLHFEGRLMISVGRLVPWKGFDILIRVLARLRKKFKDLSLFVVGNGPDLAKLEEAARREGVQNAVIFAGAVDHDALMRYIKASDVFALNTSYEGLSHLLLETLAVGVPIVTTAVGGNPEVIEDGVNGYLVEPNDAKALAARITKLFEEPATYERIQRAGLARAALFSDARVLRETAELLKSL